MKHGLLVMVLVACSTGNADPLAPSGLDLAVSTRALERVPDGRPTIVATKTGIVVEGKAIVSIANGDVDPAEKEGGALGIKIPRLAQFMTALAATSKAPKPPMD